VRVAIDPHVAKALPDAARRLADAGCPAPTADALALAEKGSAAGHEAALRRFEELVERRADLEPLAYLLGR
jgi:methylase of polypeptide subunit release factors